MPDDVNTITLTFDNASDARAFLSGMVRLMEVKNDEQQWVKDQAAAGQAVFGREGLVRLGRASALASSVPGNVNQPSATHA